MIRRFFHAGVVSAVAGAVLLAAPTGAYAQDATGRDYGHHVAHCAQTMGFDGTHNPGMHRGYAGWSPMHPC